MGPTDPFLNFPERIGGLRRLTFNLWWSWHRQARELFRALDLQAWRESEHNPVRMLALLPHDALEDAARNRAFLEHYDAVMRQFEADVASSDGWFPAEHGLPRAPLAYFSAEYAFHASLPLYAGGLGILAGDYIKECSDLAIPVVAVGLVYAHGYVWQKIRDDGWQEDEERVLDRIHDPIAPVLDSAGNRLTVELPLFDPLVHVGVWKIEVGRIPVYLLDTDIEVNQPWDRTITHHLYAINPEQRLRQEIVLGIGGMRVLEALGIQPSAIHVNEGHPAFAFLEPIRLLVHQGRSFEEAIQEVRATSIFTTHTPVAAGTDIFPFPLVEKYFDRFYGQLGTSRDTLFQLGVAPGDPGAGFNMTAFALRMARFCSAVSKRHSEVTRKIWSSLWPDQKTEDVPIAAINNGVHLASWVDPMWLQPLFDRYLAPGWLENQDQPGIWELVEKIPDVELWHLRLRLKAALVAEINKRARGRWQTNHVAAGNVVAFGALLDFGVLTLGFARRFTGYKRPDLILYDLERLKRLLRDPLRPVQIVFAGKAHPTDLEGKRLIQKVFQLARDPEFGARIAFVESYDQHLAELMVRGVDVWLNTPLPPLEASGTSGMKACVNGVPHLSVLDGWWIEGYKQTNGWAFGGATTQGDRRKADAEALYSLLEEQIIPLYYRRSYDEVPHGFVQMMKAAIKSVAPVFTTRRMAKDYAQRFYIHALGLVASERKLVPLR